jgi:hypothetical protein
MRPNKKHMMRLSIVIAAFLISGCSDLPGISSPARTTGSIQINASVNGESVDRDPDGFTVSVDDGLSIRLPVNGLAVRDLTVGRHSVKIAGVALNCSVDGANPKVVDVSASDAAVPVPFVVACLPNVGSLKISAVTTGEEVSSGSYFVSIGSNGRFSFPINGGITIPNVRAGAFNLQLDGVPLNCDHLGSPVRPTTVVFGTATEVVFTLRCVATGRFQVTTTTAGVDLQPFSLSLEVSQALKGIRTFNLIPSNGTVELPGFPPGDYSLRLHSIPNNCSTVRSVIGSVAITTGVTPIAFDVACARATQIAYTRESPAGSKIQLIRSNGYDSFQITSQTGSNVDPDWSPDGSRLAFTSDRDGRWEIYVMDADGRNVTRLTNIGMNYRPAWSPDGSRIAFVSERDGDAAEIYVMNADGENVVRTTNHDGNDDAPAWSPDGQRLAFQSDRDGGQKIWIMNANGSGALPLVGSISGDRHPSWSPDGKKIAFSRTPALPTRDIYTLNIDGSHLERITSNYPDASDPTWSPDGTQIAFAATFCSDGYLYYYSTCERQILLAWTNGNFFESTPVLGAGSNPAWQR